ncbi:MAG: sulfite exporter TauE/SafE family protein [Thermoproteota archaeon]|nr:sulfite exporter TauE/SafE family protein [Thermoproteota archaeon]
MHQRCWEVTDISNETAVLVFVAPLFFGISFIYSSVGFGGGSSYIAILVLFGISLFAVPPIAQILNIIVAGIAMITFARAKHLSLKFSLPFLSSVPFAFFAGTIALEEQYLTLIFVTALFAASAALLLSGIRGRFKKKLKEENANVLRLLDIRKIVLIGIPTGIILGIVAGLVGIGGGIWLSPLLILAGIADAKRAAATSSVFIVANSISGFLGQSVSRPIDLAILLPLAFVVLGGGLLGSRLGALRLDHDKIRIIVGAIVAIAGLNLMIKFLLS